MLISVSIEPLAKAVAETRPSRRMPNSSEPEITAFTSAAPDTGMVVVSDPDARADARAAPDSAAGVPDNVPDSTACAADPPDRVMMTLS